MIRKYDWRLAKGNRYYTIQGLAMLYGVSPATVRAWIKSYGLDCAVIDETRPLVMKGSLIRAWMKKWQDNRGWECGAGEISCLSCRAPRRLKAGSAQIQIGNTQKITLRGECETCGGALLRLDVKANLERLEQDFGPLKPGKGEND